MPSSRTAGTIIHMGESPGRGTPGDGGFDIKQTDSRKDSDQKPVYADIEPRWQIANRGAHSGTKRWVETDGDPPNWECEA